MARLYSLPYEQLASSPPTPPRHLFQAGNGTMSRTSMVVGIDVSSEQKGFHAVALQGGTFVNKTITTDPAEIVAWSLDQKATAVAVHAPCGSIKSGSMRQAERDGAL